MEFSREIRVALKVKNEDIVLGGWLIPNNFWLLRHLSLGSQYLCGDFDIFSKRWIYEISPQSQVEGRHLVHGGDELLVPITENDSPKNGAK